MQLSDMFAVRKVLQEEGLLFIDLADDPTVMICNSSCKVQPKEVPLPADCNCSDGAINAACTVAAKHFITGNMNMV